MTTRQILVDTKAKISSLETWTRGALARNESYGELDPDDPKATCWCVEGALILAAHGEVPPERCPPGYRRRLAVLNGAA